jgi:hypothetical protein
MDYPCRLGVAVTVGWHCQVLGFVGAGLGVAGIAPVQAVGVA